MCLTIQSNFKPLIATRNLRVFKTLKKCEDGSYVTSIQQFPVKLNDTLMPNKNSKDFRVIGDNDCRTEIGNGYIHAWINFNIIISDISSLKIMEAYIPKGAKYYIDIECRHICTDRLYITNKNAEPTVRSQLECSMLYEEVYSLTREEIFAIVKPIIDSIPISKISPGWIYTSDKIFVHPNDIQNSDDAIGVVVYKDKINNNIVVFSVDEYEYTWDEANRICKEYSKTDDDLGRWKIPLKEVFQNVITNNITQINTALFIINKKVISDNFGYWASDKDDFVNAWHCGIISTELYNDYKGTDFHVRLSFTSHTS